MVEGFGVHNVLIRCQNLFFNVSSEFKIPRPEALLSQMLNETFERKF